MQISISAHLSATSQHIATPTYCSPGTTYSFRVIFLISTFLVSKRGTVPICRAASATATARPTGRWSTCSVEAMKHKSQTEGEAACPPSLCSMRLS